MVQLSGNVFHLFLTEKKNIFYVNFGFYDMKWTMHKNKTNVYFAKWKTICRTEIILIFSKLVWFFFFSSVKYVNIADWLLCHLQVFSGPGFSFADLGPYFSNIFLKPEWIDRFFFYKFFCYNWVLSTGISWCVISAGDRWAPATFLAQFNSLSATLLGNTEEGMCFYDKRT